ncbi:MAG: DNA recombination protein RmuC [Chlorobiota bacterium]
MLIALLILNILVLILVFLNYRKPNSTADNANDIEEKFRELKEINSQSERNFRAEIADNFRGNREELSKNFSNLKEDLLKRNDEQATRQTDKFIDFERRIKDLSQSNEERIEKLKESIKQELSEFNTQVDKNLNNLRDENNKHLQKMQETVDEKLQKTLESRIAKAFSTVSERLEEVHKGLGEMKQLANDVDGLNKVLSNVKLKGVLGEYQLEQILEQILAPSLYEKNAQTKENTQQRVEFVVKLPGEGDDKVLLPIDSKFPSDSYRRLVVAFEENNEAEAIAARKELQLAVRKYAKDINEKYINPGVTTDFAIMFLPFEGMYAEVLRDPGLFHEIQNKYKVNLTGPTTLAAFLNSMQMGFRTLAIQERSSEVWKILGAVKHEFGKFGEVLDTTLTQLERAKNNINDLVGVRTRQMHRKLKDVSEYQTDTDKLLYESNDIDSEEEL